MKKSTRQPFSSRQIVNLILLPVIVLLIAATPLLAHGLHTETKTTDGVVQLHIEYGDGSPFAYESYEVFGPGDTVPFMNGRSDARGRILFIPDRNGDWRVRFFSEDGHGGERMIPVSLESEAKVDEPADPASNRLQKVIAGMGYVLGLFGILIMIQNLRRKGTAREGTSR